MKTRINLLSSDLLPEQQRLTLQRTVLLWAGCLLLLVAFQLYQQFQRANYQQQLLKLQQQQQDKQVVSTGLSNQLAAMAPSQILLNQKQKLQGELRFHQQLLNQIQQESSGHYSAVLAALADADHPDIWLQAIQYDGQQLALSGATRSPDSVAEWLVALGQQPPFHGHSFDKIELVANDKSHRFQLNSKLTDAEPQSTETTQELAQ